LVAEREARDQRREESKAAAAGVDRLLSELADAQTASRRARMAVSVAAEQVIVGYLGLQAERYWALRCDLDKLAGMLTGAASVWPASVDGPLKPLRISADTASAIRDIEEQRTSGLRSPIYGAAEATAKFGDWHKRLCSDADAELDAPTTPPPPAGVVPIGRKAA
jgi:hypothetical protein